MTKKDYIKIAKILKWHRPEGSVRTSNEVAHNLPTRYETFGFLVSDLIEMLKKDNKDFNEKKFREVIYKD